MFAPSFRTPFLLSGLLAALALACGGAETPSPERASHHGGDHQHTGGDHQCACKAKDGKHHGGGEHHAGGKHHAGGEHAAHRSPHGMQHSFKGGEKWAARFDAPGRDAWQKPQTVIDAVDVAPGMVVADIGAGTGYFAAHLSTAVGARGKVLALDVEPDMVRYMKERGAREGWKNVEPRVVERDDPGLSASSVERILIVDTWHHIQRREGYARKLAAALRPGGTITVVDFKKDSDKGPPRRHKLAPEVVVAELEAAGLRTRTDTRSLPEQYIITASAAKAETQ